MRVIDLGPSAVAEQVTWVDPSVAAALHPAELPWVTDVPDWDIDQRKHSKGELVTYNGVVYVAKQDIDPGVGAPSKTPDNDPADWEIHTGNARTGSALAEATWLLNVLTRNKLHGVECWTEDYAVHSCEVILRRGPVANIKRVWMVKDCGREIVHVPFEKWCLVNSRTISVCCGCAWSQSPCGCGNTVMRVEYQTASNMPPGTASIVAWLAAQNALAAAGSKCGLPDRVSNVTRQGVSWTVLDPQDFLEKGKVGISRIDQWLEGVHRQNGHATLIDPFKSDRVFSERQPCSDKEAQFGDMDPADPKPDPFSDAFRHNSLPGDSPNPDGQGGPPPPYDPSDIVLFP